MNTLYLHVGTPKTGTSAIQAFLKNNNNELNNSGFSYPLLPYTDKGFRDWRLRTLYSKRKSERIAAGRVDKNGYALKHAYIDWPASKKNELFKCIEEELKKYNCIISDEGLWTNPYIDINSIIADLRERFEDVRIVVYLRRQDLYLDAKWNEHIKTNSISTVIDDYIVKYENELDYNRILTEFEKLVGKDNIILRVYEKGQFLEGDLIRDFVDACGFTLDWEKVKIPGRVNERLDGEKLWMKYFINKYYSQDQPSEIVKREMFAYRAVHGQTGSGYLSAEQRKTMLDKYSEGNTRIAERYLNRKWLFKDEIIDIERNECDISEREKRIIELFSDLVSEYEDDLKVIKSSKMHI